ncbi:MAG: ABC transporter permease, partial [Myxococcota bacterium]|nr:ABC transporter permease [Myxococcota bacterium]
MSTLAALQEALSTVGGSLALAFIVAIALGICATTALFMGSAVVVLERFARAVQRPGSVALATLLAAGLLGALGADAETVEAVGLSWPGTLAAWALASLAALPLLALAQGLVAGLLRFVPPAGLGLAAVAVLGAGLGLFVGGLDRPGYAVAPLAVAAGVWGALRLRRRRAGAGVPRLDERLARLLAAVLVVGAVLPPLLAAPRPEVSALGAAAVLVMCAAVVLGLLPLAVAGLLDTRGSAEWFIARRYLFAKRRQTFISVITLICVAGVAAGVWLIITVLSVMNGFESVWREEIIGNRAHLTVRSPLGPIEDYRTVLERLAEVPDVVGASPFLDAEGMVRGDRGAILGVRIHGIDPERVGTVTDLQEDLLPGSEGALSALGPPADGGDPGIVVGSQLAGHLGIGVGDALLLVSPFGGPPTPLGPGPRIARFEVVGLFRSSFFQYDEVYTYVGLRAAQDFRRVGDVVDGIEVRT